MAPDHRTCLVDRVVEKAEQRFIMVSLLHILATVVSLCFDHASLQSRVTPSSAVISVTVVADVYSVESSAYIDTLALLKARRISLVKILYSKGPRQLPWGMPDPTWIMLERLPSVFC